MPDVLPGHVGSFVWKNPAELVWECTDGCPHPFHEREAEGLPACRTSMDGHPHGCRCR